MAEGDLTLTARLRLEVDPNQVRAELQKAGGIIGQAAGGGGGMAGGLAQRASGGQDSTGQMLRVLGLGAVGGGAIVGSYVVLQRILRLMENSPLFGSTWDMLGGGLSTFFGSVVDSLARIIGLLEAGQRITIGLYNASASLQQGTFIDDAAKRLYYLIWPNAPRTPGPYTPEWKPGTDYYSQEALNKLFPGTSTATGSGTSYGGIGAHAPERFNLGGSALAWLKNLGPSAAYASENPPDSYLGIGKYTPARFRLGAADSFMAQWGAENPGGAYNQWKSGPPSVFGMRSAGTYDTLVSQLMSGTRLAQTSQWGNTDIGAQGKWWGPSANSGDILSRLQQYYQIANYGGAVPNGWGWGDVSKQIEKMLADPSAPKSGSYLMGNIANYIEPRGRTWSRTGEYGEFMSDIMTMGSPGITPPDIGTLFSGLTFAPEIKVTIGAQELNDIITQIIESGNFTTRTAI